MVPLTGEGVTDRLASVTSMETRMETEISFGWWRERDPKDYEIKNAGNRPTFAGILRDDWPRIRAKGIALDPYNPIDEFPDLYERFARVRSEADVIKFVRAYGPLTHDGLGGKGDTIQKVQRQAESMAAGNLHVGLVLCNLDAVLAADHDGIHLRVKPANLLDALWLQFAQAASKGLANRCKQCKAVFATGPDTKRRKGAEFCSVECKTKFHSLKRSRR
jgi:hypothetical protein